jgi:hypothetical protein
MAALVAGEMEPVFSSLGSRMSLFVPPDPAVGELIVLCTWLGAGKKHIAKYVREYRKIAPYARILLIESSVWIVTARYSKQREAIKPAVDAVRIVLDECKYSGLKSTTRPKIVIHTFSNGGEFLSTHVPIAPSLILISSVGTNSATQLLIVLRKQLGYLVPISSITCDSGPARGAYWKTYLSMTTSLPKGLFWQIVGPPIVLTTCNVLFSSQWLGWEKPEDMYRRTLLDKDIVSCKRICYIYSKADTHVDCDDVTSHAEIARQKGWDVEQILFEDTPHCNHISKYRAEYVDVMTTTWQSVIDKSGAA